MLGHPTALACCTTLAHPMPPSRPRSRRSPGKSLPGVSVPSTWCVHCTLLRLVAMYPMIFLAAKGSGSGLSKRGSSTAFAFQKLKQKCDVNQRSTHVDVLYLQVKPRSILFNATAAAPLNFPWPGNQTSLAVPPATRAAVSLSTPFSVSGPHHRQFWAETSWK